MALQGAKSDGGGQDDPCTVKVCPICTGQMEVAYDRYHQKVCVCVDCNVALTIPGSAWEVARLKRETPEAAK
jgi:hypothetical protein